MVVAAIIAGVLVGAVSVVPFNVATKKVRHVNAAQSLGMLAPFLLTILISFIILIAGILICKLIAPDLAITFSVAELLAFVVGVIVFGFFTSKRR